MAFRRRTPQPWRRSGWTPQPDRDFGMGARPQDTLNRIRPGQQGLKGGIAGLGQANSFKPKQGQMRRRVPGNLPATPQAKTQAAKNAGVQMSFSGDPAALAQTFQALVNQTGQVQTQSNGDPGQGFVDSLAGPMQNALNPQTATATPPVSEPTSQPVPTSPTAPPNFESLQGYIDAIGGLDFIAEDAFSPYAGWQPRLPQMMQAKNALDQQFLSSVVAAGTNQEVAKAFTQAALARAVQDEMLDQERNREAMNERGMFNSSITGKNAGLIKKDYLRSAEDTFADLISQLTGQSSELQSGYGSYLDKILGLASEEAGSLVDIPGAGATPTPDVPASGGGGGSSKSGKAKPNKKANKPWGFFGYTYKEWQALPEKKRKQLKTKFRKKKGK